ncbi:hypothetical protein AHAS_Ahas19G0284800 [Arachis hypogaea]
MRLRFPSLRENVMPLTCTLTLLFPPCLDRISLMNYSFFQGTQKPAFIEREREYRFLAVFPESLDEELFVNPAEKRGTARGFSLSHLGVGSMQIAEALQMQMEVQKKLYEQIEVQRHLQLKIEAQGKYLQSVLHKAQELAGMINNGSPGSPPISKLTETRGGFSWSCGQRKQNRGTMCSLEI